jgi:hypothetical protein
MSNMARKQRDGESGTHVPLLSRFSDAGNDEAGHKLLRRRRIASLGKIGERAGQPRRGRLGIAPGDRLVHPIFGNPS